MKWAYFVLLAARTSLGLYSFIDIWHPCMDQEFSSKDFMVFLIFACSLHSNDTNKSLLKFFIVVV